MPGETTGVPEGKNLKDLKEDPPMRIPETALLSEPVLTEDWISRRRTPPHTPITGAVVLLVY
jgi:hypothetical protein